MTENEKKFLLTLKLRATGWDLIAAAGIEQLPAIPWKLVNIRKMGKKMSEYASQKGSVLKN